MGTGLSSDGFELPKAEGTNVTESVFCGHSGKQENVAAGASRRLDSGGIIDCFNFLSKVESKVIS